MFSSSLPGAVHRAAPGHPRKGAQPPTWVLLLLLLVTALPARAQSVRWDPPGGQLGFNQVSQLALVFENCEPEGAPALPTVDGLVFGRPSESSETSVVNFKVSRRYSLVYPVRPAKRAPLTLPAFTVRTDQGELRVPAATYTVGDAPVGSTGVAIDDIATATLSTPKTTLWAGEVFPLTYELSVVRRYFHSIAQLVEWPAAPFVAEEWTKPEPSEPMIRGERRLVATQTTRASAKQPGRVVIQPASQLVNLVVGQTGFGLFAQSSVEQRVLTSEPLAVTIRPLPPAPAEFSGAVGQFTLVSRVVPTTPTVGEPVTWTLELAGTGNWPDLAGLPAREVSRDFSVVQPKARRTMKDNALFEGTLSEDVVLVPAKPGTYTLGPVRFQYFDPAQGAYQTLRTEPVTLTVGAAAGGPQPAATPGGPVQFSLGPAGGAPTPGGAPAWPEAVAPVPPENLPRDPLPAGSAGAPPLAARSLVAAVVVLALLPPLALWLALAAGRSRALDPQRARREARAALARTLAAWRAGPPTPALLQAWQRHAAALWQVAHAAPGASLLQAGVAARAPAAGPVWAQLWAEVDRALHGRETVLPADWVLRAEAALQAVRVPGWPLLSLFAPRHLFPGAGKPAAVRPTAGAALRAAVGLAVMGGLCGRPPPAGAAEPGLAAYQRADFAAAEQAWRAEAAAHPADWAVRHNLGLALAQREQWAEATAQWTAAFLREARSGLTRWDLALGLQRSGLAPPELVGLARGEGWHALARLATPGEWHRVLLGAALLFALALGLLLLRGYGRLGPGARPAAMAVLLAGIGLAATATLALRTYGVLAEPGAALVWRASTLRSVPTEADTQKVSPLAPGSLAVADRTFLGWTRLRFPGGQTGWARTADLVWLHR